MMQVKIKFVGGPSDGLFSHYDDFIAEYRCAVVFLGKSHFYILERRNRSTEKYVEEIKQSLETNEAIESQFVLKYAGCDPEAMIQKMHDSGLLVPPQLETVLRLGRIP